MVSTPPPRTSATSLPPRCNAALVLSDGSVFFGRGIGVEGLTGGELCFNTSMTGYQEILSDPSYAGQLITFTFPHIGNVGCNTDDMEAARVFAKGLILRTDITSPSNHRSQMPFDKWLAANKLTGICGVDTRRLTQHLRKHGAQNAVIAYSTTQTLDIDVLVAQARQLPDMSGQDIAAQVTTPAPYEWREGSRQNSVVTQHAERHVVVIDYGVKRNILRCLADQGMRLTVVPCTTTAADILELKPDGVFLSNGPGDPAATGVYAIDTIRDLLRHDIPLFGICLGHQLLALALGARTGKLPYGHRGGNHPVKNLLTGKVDITSQNHGFHVLPDSLPNSVETTHISLFDHTNEGLRLKNGMAFSVQYHPEASPGPHESHVLFSDFRALIDRRIVQRIYSCPIRVAA